MGQHGDASPPNGLTSHERTGLWVCVDLRENLRAEAPLSRLSCRRNACLRVSAVCVRCNLRRLGVTTAVQRRPVDSSNQTVRRERRRHLGTMRRQLTIAARGMVAGSQTSAIHCVGSLCTTPWRNVQPPLLHAITPGAASSDEKRPTDPAGAALTGLAGSGPVSWGRMVWLQNRGQAGFGWGFLGGFMSPRGTAVVSGNMGRDMCFILVRLVKGSLEGYCSCYVAELTA